MFLEIIAQPSASPPPASAFSDDFNRADSTVISGGSVAWTEYDMAETVATGWEIVSNQLVNPTASYLTAIAGDTGSADHYAECTVGALSGSSAFIGPAVRLTSDGGEGYILTAWVDRCRLYKMSGGTLGIIADWGSGTNFTGDTITLTASGTTLTGYANGVQIGTTTDATFSTGQYVGILGRNSAVADNFTGDSGAYTPPALERAWFAMPTRQIFQPVGSGSNVNVSSASALDAALTNAVPGDCINLATAEYGAFVWGANSTYGHASGTVGNPITLQAQAGASPTFTGSGVSNEADVLRLEDVDYFRVSGIEVSNGQYGYRHFSCTNGEVLNNKLHNMGHSILVFQYWSRPAGTVVAGDPSSNILVEGNEIYDSGQSATQYGEGIYLGQGSAPYWADECHDIEIRNNYLHDLSADGIDIKPGCYNIYIHHNDFKNVENESGAVIHCQSGALDNLDTYDPKRTTLERVTEIHHNRFWNIGHTIQTAVFGITCGHGGEKIYNNLFWGFWNNAATRAINIRHLQNAVSDYAVDIYNNTIWVDNSINKAYDFSAPTGGVNIWDNITQDGAAGSTETISSGADQVAASVFLGPVPTVNTSSEAIGTGNTEPGSAFIPDTATSVPAAAGTEPADDLTDIPRPQGARTEKGAIEYLA